MKWIPIEEWKIMNEEKKFSGAIFVYLPPSYSDGEEIKIDFFHGYHDFNDAFEVYKTKCVSHVMPIEYPEPPEEK